jgi:hypothetical protein
MLINFHSTGYDQGVFGGIIVTPDFLEQMGNPGPSLQGTIVSLYDIGWYVSFKPPALHHSSS